MKVLFALAVSIVIGLGQSQVREKTAQYFKTIDDKIQEGEKISATLLNDFYVNDGMVVFDTELPVGGVYSGPQNISLGYLRMYRMLEYMNPKDTQMLACDEAKGTCLVLTKSQVKFARTKKSAEMKLLHILEWDQVSMKILHHSISDTDHDKTLEAYRTNAEKNLMNLIWKMMESTYADLIDKSSAVWQLVSDDLKVNINIYPKSLLSKTEFNGKQEAINGLKECMALKMKNPLPLKEAMFEQLEVMQILYANEIEVYVAYMDGSVIARYTFENGKGGKLLTEEMIHSSPMMPWKVYPFPMPLDERAGVMGEEELAEMLLEGDDEFRRRLRSGEGELEEEVEEQGHWGGGGDSGGQGPMGAPQGHWGGGGGSGGSWGGWSPRHWGGWWPGQVGWRPHPCPHSTPPRPGCVWHLGHWGSCGHWDCA